MGTKDVTLATVKRPFDCAQGKECTFEL